jgi:mannose-1-phosphate guanylyltransferase
MVDAIILAGGYATRLRPLSLTKPKSLLPILGKPILDHILERIAEIGARRTIISARVLAEKIVSNYSNREGIVVEVEPEPLGDAGPLGLIRAKYNLSDDVLVVYGDIYAEANFREVIDHHVRSGCNVTVVGTKVSDPRRYGVIIKGSNGIMSDLIEKPSHPASNLINAGIYVFRSEVLKSVKGKGSISRNLIPEVLKRGCISVFEYEGIWADIGIPKDYLELNFQLLSRDYPRGLVEEGAKLSEGIETNPPYFIGRGSVVGRGSLLDSLTILGRDCVVGENSYVGRSLLMDGVTLGKASFIKGSILGERVITGKWVHIREGSIVGDEVAIHDGVMLNQRSIVLPYKEISSPIVRRGEIIL